MINRKGQNFGFGQNLEQILLKYFGRKQEWTKETISAESNIFGQKRVFRPKHATSSHQFRQNVVPEKVIYWPKLPSFDENCLFRPNQALSVPLAFGHNDDISAEITLFWRKLPLSAETSSFGPFGFRPLFLSLCFRPKLLSLESALSVSAKTLSVDQPW